MIPSDIKDQIYKQGYSQRTENKEAIRRTLNALRIVPSSELGIFYLSYDPSILLSKTSNEQLEDILAPTVDGTAFLEVAFDETPVGMTTMFVREVWEVPENFICLTSTEGEGAYLYDLSSGAVYDFDLGQDTELREGALKPRWESFFYFIRWYLTG